MIEHIKKRDGRIVDFDKNKITEAIFKAAQAVGGTDRFMAEHLSAMVVAAAEKKYKDTLPTVEEMQDLVEKILIEEGHAKTAKAFILYREQHAKIRETNQVVMDIQDTMDGYLKQYDWRVNENSNVDYSFSGLFLHIAGSMLAKYTLERVYPQKIAQAHQNGDFHLHDLSFGIAGYCAGWSIRQLLTEGFNGVQGKIESSPPKHLSTATIQIMNFLGSLQNEWAGAQAFSSFDTYLAPFVKKDNLSYEQVKQAVQQLVFNLNISSRWGGQTPFTNLTLDWVVPEDMRDQQVIIGGKLQKETYADFQDEMDMINKAFIETLTAGDMHGRVFTFPIPTYNITKDFDWKSENADLLFEMAAKYGLPYFQNFVNSELKPTDVRSMCCRLQLNMKELSHKTGGLFGFGESTGSVGVVTINLPRIGYLSKTEDEYFQRLAYLMDLARDSLELKKKVVNTNIQQGLLPYTKRYLGNLDHHFLTIGLNGMNEASLNFLKQDITTKEGRAFSLRTLDFMRDKLSEYQEKTGHIYNLEATPAEGTSYRFARIDKKKYPGIVAQGTKEPFYTNSTQLPVGHTSDMFEAMEMQDELQTKYTGGTVFHAFVGERISSAESCKSLVKKMAHSFRMPYFTITPTFSICQSHGYIAGEQPSCPACGNSCDVYSRVVGYYRPVRNWNLGKKEEFSQRLEFSEPEMTRLKQTITSC